MIPLELEFGWGRAQVSLALTLFTVVLALSIPVLGAVVDRVGSRRVVLPSVLIFAVLLACVGLLVQELWHLAGTHPSVELRWIRAHDGSRWNEYVDALATTYLREGR